MNLFLPRALLGLFVLAASFLQAAPISSKHATVELISEVAQVAPGARFNVAVHFEIEPHWHIYWKNPGASGLPLELEWDLPEGFVAGEIEWPAPEQIELAGLVNYGYEDVVTFIVPIEAPADISGPIALKADAFWLICKEVCLPGDATLTLNLPVGDTVLPSDAVPLFDAAKASQPEALAPWALSARMDTEANQLVLRLDAAEVPVPMGLYFYVGSEGVIDPSADQPLNFINEHVVELRLTPDVALADAPLERLTGVLQGGGSSWSIDVPVGDGVVADGEGVASAIVEFENGGFEQRLLDLGLPGFLALAFLGGFILNVMPCVLPVLSLKVFSLLKHSGQSKQQALMHGLAYTAGVVVSFLALAGALFALRALGERIGWGFQLQNPNFVVLLAVVFFLFGLNLMGVFELGSRLVGADAKVAQRHDVLGSFGMGVLAAVVGAPCMGPLVASVSGIAVQASVLTGLLIFGVMGLGLASPFLVLSVFPKMVAYLPKPGVWMESFKQFMGFLLMAAVVFLALVVGRQGGVDAIFSILVVLLLSGMAAWIYGRWATPVRSKLSKRIAIVTAVGLVGFALVYGVRATRDAYAQYGGAAPAEDGAWAAWSSSRVASELAEGNPVFVDFTATWCLICQVNKKVALRTDETTGLFEEFGVVTLEADWTRYDATITDELERFGRSGVPLYVLYTPDGGVTVLPQSLTNGVVRKAVVGALK